MNLQLIISNQLHSKHSEQEQLLGNKNLLNRGIMIILYSPMVTVRWLFSIVMFLWKCFNMINRNLRKYAK